MGRNNRAIFPRLVLFSIIPVASVIIGGVFLFDNRTANQPIAKSLTATPTSMILRVAVPPTNQPTPQIGENVPRFPTPTPLPDTPPGSILNVREMWQQDGLGLQLTGTEIYPRGILASFRLTNLERNEKALRYSAADFSAADNLGGELPVGFSTCGGCLIFAQNCPPQTLMLPANGSLILKASCDNILQADAIALSVNTSNHAEVEVVIRVNGMSGITNARWRIPIQQ